MSFVAVVAAAVAAAARNVDNTVVIESLPPLCARPFVSPLLGDLAAPLPAEEIGTRGLRARASFSHANAGKEQRGQPAIGVYSSKYNIAYLIVRNSNGCTYRKLMYLEFAYTESYCLTSF